MLTNALMTLVYELFLETFSWKMIKQLIFLLAFYISHKSGDKNLLIWFINYCLKSICYLGAMVTQQV